MSHPTLQSRGNADTAVVLLTGADRLSLDSVAFSLADSYASVCAISYDVRPNGEADAGLSIVRRVSRPVGCLCSMVLRPVERLVFSPKER